MPEPQTPRILTRGEPHQFRVAFFEDQLLTTPLEPLGPDYPAYIIKNPDGVTIQSGIGTMVSPGNWKVDWTTPKDAPLSYYNQTPQQFNNKNEGIPLSRDQARYRIEWLMVTAENYQVTFVEDFDVRDQAITQAASRELKYLTMAKDPVRLIYRSTVIPHTVRLRLILRGLDETPLVNETYMSSLPANAQNIKVIPDGDSYVMYYDLAEGVTQPNTCYMALWTITETVASVPETEWQILTAIQPSLFPLMTSLRMLVDKFQKRLGRVQAFEDSDLIEYLSQGLRMVNLSYPTTGFKLDNIPDNLLTLVFLAAGWYGLKAQSILEADLGFNFSGQSVTLSVDRSGALDSAASSMMDMFNSQISAAKMAYVRTSRGMGTVAGRSYSYRTMHNYVYKVGSMRAGGANDLLGVLNKIGLL